MLGFSLLGLSLILYMFKKRKWSFFIFVTFMLNGWVVLTDAILGYKNFDLAFIYILAVMLFNIFIELKDPDEEEIDDRPMRVLVGLFIAFMLFAVYFSFSHYEFTINQILQGSRTSFIALCYFFLKKIDRETFLWLNNTFFHITLVTSVLYIVEVFYDLPVLPYDLGVKIDDITGIMRYYNSPPLLYWYLTVVILYPNTLQTRMVNLATFVFAVALIATLGRTQIGMTVGVIGVGLLMRGKSKTLVKVAVMAGILAIPFMEVLSQRFEGHYGNETENEVESIFSGGIEDMASGQYSDQGTLTYRFAWIYERMLYLEDRPMSENVFGLGLISDSQVDVVQTMYHFNLGLYNDEGYKQQMTTPDISYGNLLSKYGYVGGIIYLAIWFFMLGYFFIHRKDSEYALLGFLFVLNLLLIGVASTSVSDQGNLIFPFLLYIHVNRIVTARKAREAVEAQEAEEETEALQTTPSLAFQ